MDSNRTLPPAGWWQNAHRKMFEAVESGALVPELFPDCFTAEERVESARVLRDLEDGYSIPPMPEAPPDIEWPPPCKNC